MNPLSQKELEPILQLAENYDPYLRIEDRNILGQEVFSAALWGCRNGRWTVLSAQREMLAKISQFFGNTLLNHSIAQGEELWVKNLIQYEIDIHSTDFEGNTPLHIAAKLGFCHWIDSLLRFTQVDAKNKKGQTPLHIAIEHGRREFLENLIGKGANANLPIAIGEQSNLTLNPLGFAIMKGQKECIDVLMKNSRCNVKFTCTNVGSLIHVAVYFYQFEVLLHLLENYKTCFDIELQNNDGLTPLNLAASLGGQEAIRILHKYGASIHCKDFNQCQPMHHAAIGCHPDTIQLLAFLGAKINPKDRDVNRPLDLAKNIPGDRAKTCANLLTNLSKNKDARKFDPMPCLESPSNLVFKGGGAKGIAYLGVIRCLHEKNLLQTVERIAGTSAGAITATFLAVNYPIEELENLQKKTDMVEILLDHPFSKKRLEKTYRKCTEDVVSIVKTLHWVYQKAMQIYNDPLSIVTSVFKTLYHCTGLCEGEGFRKWLEEHIKRQTGIDFLTFGELAGLIKQGKPYKHLHIYATKAGKDPEIVHINSDSPEWKDVIISDAVRASMSIPGVFKPHILHIKSNGERIQAEKFGSFLDGGMLYNFPVETFDQKRYFTREDLGNEGLCPKFNKRTLGFSLYSSLKKKPTETSNVHTVFDLLSGICKVYLSAESSIRQLNPYNACRVIEIDIEDVGSLSFSLDEMKQEKVIQSGLQATRQFIEKYIPIQSFQPSVTTPITISSTSPITSGIPSIASGRSKWLTYFGDIGEELSLPPDIDEILNSSCPFWPDKKVRETHHLNFKPKIVNGKIFDLSLLGELVKAPRSGTCTKIGSTSLNNYNSTKESDSYWYLIVKEVIPGSEEKSFLQQKNIISNINQEKKLDYRAPKLIEVAIDISITFVSTQECFYKEDPWIVTRTEEAYSAVHQYCVGGSSQSVNIHYYKNQKGVGLSPCRRLK